ncbi:MAG: S-layer homology domain-containing protein [Candidatus Saganbacteria bacterium]|nr:S-layer homology domain-containing protein [Candidatus Saganbacteria bacterium]
MKQYIIAVFILCLSVSAWATVDIGEIGVGARVLGLGKASVGGMDDASAIFTNPAGLTLNNNLNIISMSGTILTDINYLVIGVTENAPIGRVGIGYINASVGGIPITTITGTGSTAAVSWESNADYGSSVVFFTYGTPVSRFLRGNFENISIGASLKYFLQSFNGGGTSLQDAVGSGMDADLGLTLQANDWARIGLTFNNCLPMSAGGKFTWKRNSVEESIPMATRLGGNFQLLGEKGWQQSEDKQVNLNLEYESGRGGERPSVLHTGLEFWPTKIFCFRGGIDQKPKATTTGTGVDNNLTAGLGILYQGFTFDYAYHQFGELAENTTHFFSIGYRGPEKKKAEKKVVEQLKDQAGKPITEVVQKPSLKTFTDVTDGYWARRPIEYLATLGIMNGYPDQTFRPERSLTRAELAALLVKAKGFDLVGARQQVFTDVKANSWVAPYVKVAVDRQYVKGYPDGTFKPDRQITRAEAAAVFAKFGGFYIKDKVSESGFPDVPAGHWAAPAIAADRQEGLFEYLVGKDFQPNAYLTRAEAAEILSKTPLIKDRIKEMLTNGK